MYGYCPTCNAPGISRERRPNGNDECENGHVYPSSEALLLFKNHDEDNYDVEDEKFMTD